MEHSPSESSGSSLSVFDTANITIEFRVGQAAVSVRDLSTLKTGQIIELDRPVSRTVDILADGHFVGVGELIDIEGRLGVRVTEIRRTESTTT